MEYYIKLVIPNDSNLLLIQSLAKKIWPICYKDILSTDQIGYMLNKFYSLDSLYDQCKEAHQFLLLYNNDECIGFASYQLNYINDATKLHKLYVDVPLHNKGGGTYLLRELINIAFINNQSAIYLHVNRENSAKIFYEKMGFVVLKEEDFDIGNGYFMNDYLMVKKNLI